MYYYEIKPNLQKILIKLSKKDKDLYEQVIKKIDEIINAYDIKHYKNLRYNMKDSKRVHVGHFALVFGFDKNTNTITFEDFNHHDNIYKR
ncbi:MAG: addiction module toxin RelE [Nanoarchaeota archaeon]